MSDVAYSVVVTPSALSLSILGMGMGGPLASGRITITLPRSVGGGTLGGSMPSQMGFVASAGGGQFQCQMAGFSAGFPLEVGGTEVTIIKMDVHGAAAPGTYDVH